MMMMMMCHHTFPDFTLSKVAILTKKLDPLFLLEKFLTTEDYEVTDFDGLGSNQFSYVVFKKGRLGFIRRVHIGRG